MWPPAGWSLAGSDSYSGPAAEDAAASQKTSVVVDLLDCGPDRRRVPSDARSRRLHLVECISAAIYAALEDELARLPVDETLAARYCAGQPRMWSLAVVAVLLAAVSKQG